jgi:mannonate dehydratase
MTRANVSCWRISEVPPGCLQRHASQDCRGLTLEAIENVPFYFYKKIALGLPGYEEQLQNYCETVRNLGRAGIPVLGYHFMGNRVWRTSKGEHARGEALTSSFDLDLVRNAPPTDGVIIDEKQMWENYERFITTVLPVAEEAGVTLSLHPDDPPVPSLGGVARIFRSLAGFRRALEEIGNSPNHKVTFCMGTFAELGVDAMFEAMEHFARNDRIAYVHFRNVKGTIPKFSESFVDEGDVDCVAAIRRLRELNFKGFLIDDHVPHMSGDTVYMHRSRAFAIGYIRGLIHAVAGREAVRT